MNKIMHKIRRGSEMQCIRKIVRMREHSDNKLANLCMKKKTSITGC